MFSRSRLVLLIPLAALAGCVASTSSNSTSSNGSSFWQIQQGAAITSPPTGTYFVGLMQIEGTQATAAFTTPTTTGTEVLDFAGTYNPVTGNVVLQPTLPETYEINFTVPPTPDTVVPVGVIGGCVYPLGYTGAECNAIFSIPSVGVETIPLTGTYTGTLTETASPSLSGAATLTLTQSTTPNSSGLLPLSGTLTFPAASGFGTVPLGGTVSGAGILLSDSSAAPNSPTVNLTAAASPDGSQITVSNLLYSNFGPGAVFLFTGTLTRQ